MTEHQLLFIGGLHKSGTSLLHRLLRAHPRVSGFSGTGVPEDEGQHLQTVYPAAKVFGGPGRFAFDSSSFMDDHHPLATAANAARLLEEWSRYWDLSKRFLVEKSPPNIVRTRFLQSLFPSAAFLIILRHPIAVSYATQQWSVTPISSLLEHTLLCYERFRDDLPFLSRAYVLRYEELVAAPRLQLDALLDWLGLERLDAAEEVRRDVNARYFASWRNGHDVGGQRPGNDLAQLTESLDSRAAAFAYRMEEPERLDPLPFAGPHGSLAPAGGART